MSFLSTFWLITHELQDKNDINLVLLMQKLSGYQIKVISVSDAKYLMECLEPNDFLCHILPPFCFLNHPLVTTWILHLSMHIQNFIKIHPFDLKIWRETQFYINQGP